MLIGHQIQFLAWILVVNLLQFQVCFIHPSGHMPQIIFHLWQFLCIRNTAGGMGNKITATRHHT